MTHMSAYMHAICCVQYGIKANQTKLLCSKNSASGWGCPKCMLQCKEHHIQYILVDACMRHLPPWGKGKKEEKSFPHCANWYLYCMEHQYIRDRHMRNGPAFVPIQDRASGPQHEKCYYYCCSDSLLLSSSS